MVRRLTLPLDSPEIERVAARCDVDRPAMKCAALEPQT